MNSSRRFYVNHNFVMFSVPANHRAPQRERGIPANQHIWGKSQMSCCFLTLNDLQQKNKSVSPELRKPEAFFYYRCLGQRRKFMIEFETLRNEKRAEPIHSNPN